ncbi:MAG: TIGR00289 family protein [Archaeoglobus sp.]|nr:TIGR00289 family protein [Archaeoglobus sp.]
MRVAALISGGKDSLLASYLASKSYEVVCYVAVIPANPDSYMYHTPNLGLVDAIAQSVAKPIFKVPTEGVEEKEVDDLERALKLLDVEGLVVGGIASNYQKRRFEKICNALGMELIAPLWGWDDERVITTASKLLDFIIVKVSAMGLDESWLGRKVDENAIEDLKKIKEKHRIHSAGEGGEFETLVLDAPFFRRRIEIKKSHVVSNSLSATLVIDDFELVEKLKDERAKDEKANKEPKDETKRSEA